MSFENRVENVRSSPFESSIWTREAAQAYAPVTVGSKRSKGVENPSMEAGLGSPLACNPSLPKITHQQFLNQLGIPKGHETSTTLVPPKGWDANRPNAKYHEWNHEEDLPHLILQPCEGEPLLS